MAEEMNTLEDLAAVADAPVAEPAAPREPQRDELGRSYATGKRKDAVARVWIKPGSGKVTVNGKAMDVYFARPVLQMILRQPFDVAGWIDQFLQLRPRLGYPFDQFFSGNAQRIDCNHVIDVKQAFQHPSIKIRA